MDKSQIIKSFLGLAAKKIIELGRKQKLIMGVSTLMVVVICGALIFGLATSHAKDDEAQLQALETEAEVIEEMPAEIPVYYEIAADGAPVVALASEEDARKVLDGVISRYSTAGSDIVSVEYKEDVKVRKIKGSHGDLTEPEDAISLVLTGTKEPKVYTVEKGDCLWDIAKKNGMKVEELMEANPGASENNLKIGTTLNLYELKPYLHVKVVEKVKYTEKVDYKVEYEDTDKLYKGEVQVKVAGVFGKREVVSELTKENGVTVSSRELSSSIISEPSKQVNLRGTKSLATLVGTGSFVSPMGRLEISSPFGSRGGGRHTGVDLRNPKGTPIYVVDDGVVTYAKYSGSYGNIVKVSHGNGIETYYAHCDTMLVSVGDVLKKGQQIATVGITGRATGYHLHFEVRKNGVPQNPMNYL